MRRDAATLVRRCASYENDCRAHPKRRQHALANASSALVPFGAFAATGGGIQGYTLRTGLFHVYNGDELRWDCAAAATSPAALLAPYDIVGQTERLDDFARRCPRSACAAAMPAAPARPRTPASTPRSRGRARRRSRT